MRLSNNSARHTNFILARYRLGSVHEEKGMFNEAVEQNIQVGSFQSGEVLGMAGPARAYALSGKRQEAQKILNELLDRANQKYV